jgi:hypothetical protein
MAATLVSIDDVLGADYPVALDCGVTFPYGLAPSGTLTCSYEVSVAAPDTVVNHVTVTTTGAVGGGSAEATADFANATIDEIDRCVAVTDTLAGSLGTVCVGSATTFAYTIAVGPYECGEYRVDNTATYVADDTGATGSDSWSIPVTVPCPQGCTLTPGYWKTHSLKGPAPYDDTWAQLPYGADTAFFKSGATYYLVLWTPPQGNAYYILAHAYIAAKLNGLNGADFTAASLAYNEATGLFGVYFPADIAKRSNATVRARMVQLATILDQYNNGLIGPGHCSE